MLYQKAIHHFFCNFSVLMGLLNCYLLIPFLKFLKEILDKDPHSLRALLLTARLMDAKKDKPGLKNIYQKILVLNPDNGIVLYNLSVLEFEQGDSGKAQNYLKTLLKKNPQDPEALHLLFEIYKKQKQDEPALKEALILAELKPADPTYYRYIFEYLNRHDRHKEMIPILQKGLIKNPDRKELREYLILAFLKTGQEDQAIYKHCHFLACHCNENSHW